jgi:hypothetical protein
MKPLGVQRTTTSNEARAPGLSILVDRLIAISESEQ